jgi:hypothetical protein
MARTCTPLSAYIVEARRMKRKYGYSTIYLATDSQHIVKLTKQYAHEFEFLTIDDQHHDVFKGKYHGSIWDDLVKRRNGFHDHGLNPTTEAKQASGSCAAPRVSASP